MIIPKNEMLDEIRNLKQHPDNIESVCALVSTLYAQLDMCKLGTSAKEKTIATLRTRLNEVHEALYAEQQKSK